ncbi:MAG TPA: hypothetical protein VFB26_03330, partial [Gaiellaceae bacterium]|nr:hypothetical protein [Gaiellaceae bacterium]
MEIDPSLLSDDVRALVDAWEGAGTVRVSEVLEAVDAHDLDPLEHDALLRELEARGVDVVDEPVDETGAEAETTEEREPVVATDAEPTTDALQLFLREAG